MMGMNTILSGFSGVLLPYSVRTDDFFMVVLAVMCLLYAFLYSKCRKYLAGQYRNFFRDRSRNSSFTDAALVDVRYLAVLFVLACMSVGMTAYNLLMRTVPGSVELSSPALLFGASTVAILLYFGAKLLSYSIIGNVFFGRSAVSVWNDAYLLVIYTAGVVLYPFLILMVFMEIGIRFSIILLAILLIFAKIMIFCKWIKVFFQNHDSLFLLILYFCALEIVPFFLLYKGIGKFLVVF